MSPLPLGTRRRLARLLGQDDRLLVVAIDHGLFMGPIPGARVLHEVIASVVAARPDAVQLNGGAIRKSSDVLSRSDVRLVYRLDTTNVWRPEPLTPGPGYWAPKGTVQEAQHLGADAVVAFLLGGWADDAMERANLTQLAQWATEARDLGIPLMIEPLPISGKVTSSVDGELIRILSRMAVEIGCDLLKLDFDGDVDAFRELIADADVPVLVRGGPTAANQVAYLDSMRLAIRTGASGLVVGRNVFDNPDPALAVREMMELLHPASEEKAHA